MIIEKFFPDLKIDFITTLEKDYFIRNTLPKIIISDKNFAQLLTTWSINTSFESQFIFLKEKFEEDLTWNLPHPSPKIHLVNKGELKSFKLRLSQILSPFKLPTKKPFLSRLSIKQL